MHGSILDDLGCFYIYKWSLIFAQVMLYDPKQPGVFGLHLFLVQPHMKVGLSAPKNNCQEDLSCYSSLSRRSWKTIQQRCIFSGKYKTSVDGSEIRRSPVEIENIPMFQKNLHI